MSHYARLKVTQDAPVEVIRAAYRVLAAKYHPDRVAAGEAVDAEEANAEMSALNTAYQVLINPQTRADYDALLAERKALRKSKAATTKATSSEPAGPGDVGILNARVDMEWVPPKTAAEQHGFMRSRRALFLGGSLTGVLVMGLAASVWQMTVQHQMDQALSDQYAARPPVSTQAEPPPAPFPIRMLFGDGAARPRPPVEVVADASSSGVAPDGASGASGVSGASGASAGASAAASAPRRMPTVTDLSKLSNDELAQLLPLDDTPIGRRRVQRHPLDGQPLNLRQEGQILETAPVDLR